MEFAIETE